MKSSLFHIAIAGTPNVGKSTLFNQLTGLRQKVGNYPGVTVEKKQGIWKQGESERLITDLPGTYTLFPQSEDERVVFSQLTENDKKPDAVLIVIDAVHPDRGLFLASQIMDLGLPCALLINMIDQAEAQGIHWSAETLAQLWGIPVLLGSAKKASTLASLFELFHQKSFSVAPPSQVHHSTLSDDAIFDLKTLTESPSIYLALLKGRSLLPTSALQAWEEEHQVSTKTITLEETKIRYRKVAEALSMARMQKSPKVSHFTQRIDKIALHPFWGYVLFLGLLTLLFQAIFSWAEKPMEWIDSGMAALSEGLSQMLPEGALQELIIQGLIPGIGGVVIFIPQIVLLFLFLAILEDTGYMSRVVFLMDRWMRPLGLHGKSMVPLVSGVACAIPAILSTRNISHPRERLITLLVTPFMSCSARIPVYVILIGLAVPDQTIGPFQLQGLALLTMYVLGAGTALLAAFVLQKIMKSQSPSFLMIELPVYRFPSLKDMAMVAYTKAKSFVVEAGKVIVAVSVLLWILSSYGPPEQMEKINEQEVAALASFPEASHDSLVHVFEAERLKYSYMGMLGHAVEPVIAPLGYDWKIGIALIASFAAREVFVSTLSVVYALGETEEFQPIRQRMLQEVRADSGAPVFTAATAFSLMIFYAFALQCLSTVAVVYKETRSWKLTLLQWLGMSLLAYLAALLVYHLMA
jgi:ferrous iron transport protein B